MNFLVPQFGIIAAGIGLPVLLSLYFLKLRRRPVRISSTLLWAQASRDLEVNAPFRMIRSSLLLFVHLLLLALICIAIARPTLEGARQSPGSLVFVIDRSASMAALDSPGPDAPISRLQSVKDTAIDLLERSDDRTAVAVVAYADVPSIVSTFTTDRARTARAINAIVPTDQPGKPLDALRLVEAMGTGPTDESPEGQQSLRVIVLSDGEFPPHEPGARPIAIDPALIEFVPPTPLTPPTSPISRTSAAELPVANYAITSADVSRSTDDPSQIRLFCRVQAVAANRDELALTLRLNDQPVGSATIRLAPSFENSSVLEGAHTFEFTDESNGGLVVLSHAIDDALAADNAMALVVLPPIGPRVLVVQRAEPSTPIDYVITDALSVPSLRLQTLETRTIAQYEQRLPENSDASTPVRIALEDGGEPDLVIFDACTPSRLPASPSVSFGGSLPIAGMNLSAPSSSPARVAFFRRTDPLVRYSDLGDLRIERSRTLTLPEPAGGVSSVRVLAESSAGALIAEIRHLGYARVVISFTMSESSWWRTPGFPRFIKNALDTLTDSGVENASIAYSTIDPVRLTPLPGAAIVEVRGPESRTIEIDTPGSSVGLTLPRAGVYGILGAEESYVAVNLASPAESLIGRAGALSLPAVSVDASSASAIVPREIWHWFVLAAGIVLCGEWLLYAWKMRV